MSKLVIYKKDDLFNYQKLREIMASNAFVLKNGDFILVDGYELRNATHAIERSACVINRKLIKGLNLLEQYRIFLENHEYAPKLYYLREVLIHYYGLALFCDTDSLDIPRKHDKKYYHFILPDKDLFGKEYSNEQVDTIRELIKLNCEDLSDFDENLSLKNNTMI